jgi:L-ascorbate metabolism protein UlaG (beta-lactamase superfamily)
MVQILWLGHSSFQLTLGSGEVLLLDPWLDNPKYPSGHKFTRVDAILLSHGHGDHIGSAGALAKQFKAKVVGIYEVCLYLKSRGVETISPMNMGGTQQVGPVAITMTQALHSSGIEDEQGNLIHGGDPAGYVMRFADGRSAYFAGDTAVFSDMRIIAELYAPELAFLPIGDLYTMDPKQAALACRYLKPKKVIPTHWGTFPPLTGRPEQLAEAIRDLKGTEVWTLEPGKPVQW